MMALLSPGSSPSHRMAVCPPLSARWRSRQLADAFSTPSSNHLMWTGGTKEVSLIRVGARNQSMRLA